MANKKISQLLSGGVLLPTDRFPVARSGTNVSILGSALAGPALRAAYLSDVYGTGDGSTQTFDFSNGTIPSTWKYFFQPVRFDDPSKYPKIVTTDPDTISGNQNVLEFTPMTNSEFARIDIAVPAGPPSSFTFNYHILTESGYDFFKVLVGPVGNQVEVMRDSGTQPWKQFSYTFSTTNATTITLEFGKDFGGNPPGEFIRISNFVLNQAVVTNPYRVGDMIVHGNKNYLCRVSRTVQEPGTGTDWLLVAADAGPSVTALTTRVNKLEFRPSGLPYAYSGLTKYRFFRFGILSQQDNTTYISEIKLRTNLDDTSDIPRVIVRNQEYPDTMFDGDLETFGSISTFGQFTKICRVDYGTPTLIKYFQFAPTFGGGFSFFIDGSNDEQTWTNLFGGSVSNAVAKQYTTATLSIPQFTGESGYNLTANPQTNIGGFMKVNSDGTGFDFAEAASGAAGPAGPKGDKGDKGDQGIQGIQGIQGVQGPAGRDGTGSGAGGSAAALYQASNAKNLTGGGPTTITELTFTSRAGSKREIYVGFFQGTIYQGGQGGYYRVVRYVYRNGTEIPMPRYADQFIDDADLGGASVTYSVAYEYQLVQSNGTVTQSYDSTTPWEAYIKIVEH